MDARMAEDAILTQYGHRRPAPASCRRLPLRVAAAAADRCYELPPPPPAAVVTSYSPICNTISLIQQDLRLYCLVQDAARTYVDKKMKLFLSIEI